MTNPSSDKTELKVIARNAGLIINSDNPYPFKAIPKAVRSNPCASCVPPKKTMKELRELYKYMHGKDTPEEKKKDRKWLESKVF